MIDEEFDAAAGARFCAEVDDIAGGRPVDGMREDLGEGGAGFGLVDKSRKFGGRSDGKFDVAGGSGFRSRGGDGAQGVSKIGKGAIDYPAVRAFLAERNYQGWITIEQERDPRNADTSLRDVTASLHYLQSVGF